MRCAGHCPPGSRKTPGPAGAPAPALTAGEEDGPGPGGSQRGCRAAERRAEGPGTRGWAPAPGRVAATYGAAAGGAAALAPLGPPRWPPRQTPGQCGRRAGAHINRRAGRARGSRRAGRPGSSARTAARPPRPPRAQAARAVEPACVRVCVYTRVAGAACPSLVVSTGGSQPSPTQSFLCPLRLFRPDALGAPRCGRAPQGSPPPPLQPGANASRGHELHPVRLSSGSGSGH